MYYDGSIASRLRELQKETDAAYARVNFVHLQLSQAYDKIKILEEENARLKEGLAPLESKEEAPATLEDILKEESEISKKVDALQQEFDSQNITEHGSRRTKKTKRNTV